MSPFIPSPLLVVRDGVVIDANALATDELGLGAEVLIGAAVGDLIAPSDRDAVDRLVGAADPSVAVVVRLAPVPGAPPRAPEAVEVSDAVADAGTASPAGRDGSGRHVELRAAPGDDGTVLVAVRDRTEERLLNAVLDAIADTTLLLDGTGLVRWQSRATSAQVRGGPASAVGFNPLERIHPEDLPAVLEATAAVLAQPGLRLRQVARARSVGNDDAWQVIEMAGTNALQDPDVRAFVVQVRELDEATEVESLSSTDTQFLSLADAAPMGIVVADLEGRTVYRNAAARTMLRQPDPSTALDWRDLAHGSSRDELDAVFDDAVRTGRAGTVTVGFEVDGREGWLRIHVAPQLTVGVGNVYLIATLEDVTTEIEARAATDRLTHMLDVTSDYVAVFRPDGEILYVNAATRGLLETVAPGAAPDLRNLIDEASRAVMIDAALIQLQTSDVWQGNLELDAGGGRTVPVSATGLIRRLPDGELDWIAIHGRDISELKEAENLLRELASHDHLTGLANRALFNERLDRAVARHHRDATGVAVMFCDLDGFKAINDQHGHAAGDVVLSVIADRLRLVTRETDTTARVGGDEFVVVCEGITDVAELEQLAERVITAVNGPITLPDTSRTAQPPMRIRVGISVGIGVAGAELDEVDPDRLLTLADTAMYQAKAAGGTTSVVAHLDP